MIDTWLANLWCHLKISSTSLCALGSYGRREMCWYSDLDLLLIIHDTSRKDQIEDQIVHLLPLLQSIFDLPVTLVTRTWEQQHDLVTTGDWRVALSLLDARVIGKAHHLAGEDPTADKLHQCALEHILNQPSWTTHLKESYQKRLGRLKMPAYRLEPDLKNTPGTWRALHLIGVLNTHLGRLKLCAKDHQQIKQARGWLTTLRNLLHHSHGRSQDRLRRTAQTSLAHTLYPEEPEQERHALLMHHMVVHSRVLHTLLRRGLLGGDLPESANLTLKDELLRLGPERPVLPQEVEIKCQPQELEAKEFYDLLFDLSTTQELGLTLIQLGMFEHHLPQFAPLLAHVQSDTYHIYPTDEHSLICLDVAKQLLRHDTSQPPCDPKVWDLFCALGTKLHRPHLLLIAALLHDVGKNRGGDHSNVGADMVPEIFMQWPWLTQDDAKMMDFLIREHLILSTTSRRRDISDPELLNQLAHVIPTQEHLDLLILLTICDMSSVSPGALNSWRTALLFQLYTNLTRTLEQERSTTWVRGQEELAQKRERLIELFDTHQIELPIERLDAFLQDLPASHLVDTRAPALLKQINLYLLAMETQTTQVRVDTDAELGASEVLVMTPDRSGLIVTLAQLFLAQTLDVLSAEITTTSSGWALDTFRITPQTYLAHADDALKLSRARSTQLEGQITHALESSSTITRPKGLGLDPEEISVKVTQDGTRSILEVRGPDVAGLLYRIVWSLHHCGIGITFSKLDRVGDRVVDNFYVEHEESDTLSESTVDRLRRSLFEILTSRHSTKDS